jgi:valyl-tRNA synthetase
MAELSRFEAAELLNLVPELLADKDFCGEIWSQAFERQRNSDPIERQTLDQVEHFDDILINELPDFESVDPLKPRIRGDHNDVVYRALDNLAAHMAEVLHQELEEILEYKIDERNKEVKVQDLNQYEQTDLVNEFPETYEARNIEQEYQEQWVEAEISQYKHMEAPNPPDLFSIDTPPPTVSGNPHMGHLYQFTIQDIIARYHRMKNDTVFFPFGYDDNGIASERLTERERGIRHEDISRQEFREMCREVCADYEAKFTEDVQSLGLSFDWSNTYKTNSSTVQRISQLSFLDLYEKDREYHERAPTIWCPECGTAISQVEQASQDRQTTSCTVQFDIIEYGDQVAARESGAEADVSVVTVRPELLSACVALFVNPADERSNYLAGGTAQVPLFEHEVPVIEDKRVDKNVGTGIAMCSTFAAPTDVEWYQAYNLELRSAIGESGSMTTVADEYEGMYVTDARAAVIEDLDTEGYLLESHEHEHAVQVHEHCDTEVEYLISEQWYIKLLDKKDEYIQAGRELNWFPEKMYTRYKYWIERLEWDWCISRQRDSGIPIPVWYCDGCGEPILAEREDLPVDPLLDDPPVEMCPDCGQTEMTPESDVLDTWATSSLTPLINAGWNWDPSTEEFTMERDNLYPFDLRPQVHDIISYWLFPTIVKCYEHTDQIPFNNILITGMILDENRRAMSKSKGNVIPLSELLSEFPIDAVRYWTAGANIGEDHPYSETEVIAGDRFIRKIWNASRLVEKLVPPHIFVPRFEDINQLSVDNLDEIDQWLLAKLDSLIEKVTKNLEDYEIAKARRKLRHFFWETFSDYYLQIAKRQSSAEDNRSAQYTLVTVHRTLIKLLSPYLPHVTEEIWQRLYAEEQEDFKSLHTMDWPVSRGFEADLRAGEKILDIIKSIRQYRHENSVEFSERVSEVHISTSIDGFRKAISAGANVAHLQTISEIPQDVEITEEISLDYAVVGPEYGSDVANIEQNLNDGDFELFDDHLRVGQFELNEDMYEVERSPVHRGNWTAIEKDDILILIKE